MLLLLGEDSSWMDVQAEMIPCDALEPHGEELIDT